MGGARIIYSSLCRTVQGRRSAMFIIILYLFENAVSDDYSTCHAITLHTGLDTGSGATLHAL